LTKDAPQARGFAYLNTLGSRSEIPGTKEKIEAHAISTNTKDKRYSELK
jgi:hypothetical protein